MRIFAVFFLVSFSVSPADRPAPGQALVVSDYGALGQGDDTDAFQKAIDEAVRRGGASIGIPSGRYRLNKLTFPAGDAPVELIGQGESTVFERAGDIEAGHGLLDIYGSNVTLSHFSMDGGVAIPEGVLYDRDFMAIGNDPMAPSLTRNTMIWLHGPAANFRVERVRVQHTGGYAILLDAGTGTIQDVQIAHCKFWNNRPHLFGFVEGQAIYGSWTGGVYVNGDGRKEYPGRVLKGLLVTQCQFRRNTGNCLWSHLYGLDELHENFRFIGNSFEDIGLDGILVGGVSGGAVQANVFRRIGYTTVDDTSRSVPRWLPYKQATALDSSGLVRGVLYANNTFLSINGACLDLDGHADSAIVGNICRTPFPGEPEYAEDQIAISGPYNAGSASHGINTANTNNSYWGGRNVQVSGNTFINLSAGSIRLYGARNFQVSSNNIITPDPPLGPPILLGPAGSGAHQRSTGNIVRSNRIEYSPRQPAAAVAEDPAVAPFRKEDVNHVLGNGPIIGNGNAWEFHKDPNSGSPDYSQQTQRP